MEYRVEDAFEGPLTECEWTESEGEAQVADAGNVSRDHEAPTQGSRKMFKKRNCKKCHNWKREALQKSAEDAGESLKLHVQKH